MTVRLVTYATPAFGTLAELLAASARRAGADEVTVYTPEDIPGEFRSRHHAILDDERGAGWWLWKPWAVVTELGRSRTGDIVVWSDAGVQVVGPLARLTTFMDRHGLDVWFMGEGFVEAHFTKRDAFVLLGLDDHDDFIAHRHDQSILSLLSKRHGVPVVRSGLVVEGLRPPGAQVFEHTRRHERPSAVLTHLLGHAILSPADVVHLTTE